MFILPHLALPSTAQHEFRLTDVDKLTRQLSIRTYNNLSSVFA